jgi:hypothetical protein
MAPGRGLEPLRQVHNLAARHLRPATMELTEVARYQLRHYDLETPDVIETSLAALCRRMAAHMPTGSNCSASGALVVEHLRQRVLNLDQVGLVGHHLVDVLVRRRNLVEQRGGTT